jgi:hypothetical protein
MGTGLVQADRAPRLVGGRRAGPPRPGDGVAPGGWERLVRGLAVAVAVLYLGVMAVAWVGNLGAADEGMLRAQPQEAPRGLLVTAVAPGSPMDEAGVRAGDLITELAGITTADLEALHAHLHLRRAGQQEVVVVRRAIIDDAGLRYGSPESLTLSYVSPLLIPTRVVDFLVLTVVSALLVGVGVLAALQRPREAAARDLLVFGACIGMFGPLIVIHWVLPTHHLGDFADRLGAALIIVGCAALCHLFLIFPIRKAMMRHRLASLVVHGVPGLVAVAMMAQLVPFEEWLPPIALTLLGGALVALLLDSWRPMTPMARAQFKWIGWGLTIFVVAFVANLVLQGQLAGRSLLLPSALLTSFLAVLPVAIGVAIVRYRLWDIDVVINRTLVYAAVTGILAAVFFGSVVILQQPFRALTGQDSEIAVAISTVLMAALFQPVRRIVRLLIDRVFFYRHYVASRQVAAYATSLPREVDIDRLADHLVDSVATSMQTPRAWLWIRPPATGERPPRRSS